MSEYLLYNEPPIQQDRKFNSQFIVYIHTFYGWHKFANTVAIQNNESWMNFLPQSPAKTEFRSACAKVVVWLPQDKA